jgi:hypothetical protein
MRKMWKSKLPMKLKIFMWLVFQGRVQAGVVLGGMKWKDDTRCVVCGVPETSGKTSLGRDQGGLLL